MSAVVLRRFADAFSTDPIATVTVKDSDEAARVMDQWREEEGTRVLYVEVTDAPPSVTEPTARCYMEFCCNTATHDVIDYGERIPGVAKWSGRWGWCNQHRPIETVQPLNGGSQS